LRQAQETGDELCDARRMKGIFPLEARLWVRRMRRLQEVEFVKVPGAQDWEALFTNIRGKTILFDR